MDASRTIDLLRILDASDNVLWTAAPYTIPAGDTHQAVSPLVSSEGPLRLQWGRNWNVGIDNVQFSQFGAPPTPAAVPSPAAATGGLALLAGLGIARRGR